MACGSPRPPYRCGTQAQNASRMGLASQMPQTCPQNPERYFGPGMVLAGWRPRICRLRDLGRHGHTTRRCVKCFDAGQLRVRGGRTCGKSAAPRSGCPSTLLVVCPANARPSGDAGPVRGAAYLATTGLAFHREPFRFMYEAE